MEGGNRAIEHPTSGGKDLYCAYMAFSKIKSPKHLLWAARHNLRQIDEELLSGERIDAAKTHLNQHLAGPRMGDEVGALARTRMVAAGHERVRKDAVRSLEFVISLPRHRQLDEEAFFAASLAWLAGRYGGLENVLSADVHRDEANPHLHVLILPLIDGRMRGSEAIGGPKRVAALYRDFHSEVASGFGLQEPPRVLRPLERRAAAEDVMTALRSAKDPCLDSPLWPVVRDMIVKAPLPFAMTLGVSIKRTAWSKRARTSTDIFISKGKGSQRREVGA